MAGDSLNDPGRSDLGKFLTFNLAGAEYAMDILTVQEIKGFVQPTRVPNSSSEVLGVLNLRGTILPIIDLRRRLNLPESDITSVTSIIIISGPGRALGAVVDAVSEVVTISEDSVQPAPSTGISRDVLRGVAKIGDRLVILIDPESLLREHGSAVAA